MITSRLFHLHGWEFELRHTDHGIYLSVPDCGGMADSWPRVPEQLEWAERELVVLPQLEQVWPTVWKVPSGAVADVEAFFTGRGATFG